jgi:hypothetical protein
VGGILLGSGESSGDADGDDDGDGDGDRHANEDKQEDETSRRLVARRKAEGVILLTLTLVENGFCPHLIS